ncbi:MAG: TIGR02266 family protein [Deltaproteobacteria bacterium]|nr:TIGR02266 family protein [Deltaproteobacteria bacterium]
MVSDIRKSKKQKDKSRSSQSSGQGTKKEKRVDGERIPIQLLVDYNDGGLYLFDFCKDLGQGGVFIESREPKEQGSELHLTFTIPDSKETLNLKGQVMWVQKPLENRPDLIPGMGIQFIAFTPEQRKILADFVGRYSNRVGKSA